VFGHRRLRLRSPAAFRRGPSVGNQNTGRCPLTRQRERAFGFTLIELLVAVGIITLLLAILSPSLKKARAQARSASCKSNVRQTGLGMVMYHHQYGSYPAHRSPMPQDHRWFIAMTKQVVDKEVQSCPEVPDWEVGRNISYGYNYKYLGSARKIRDENKPPSEWEYENWPVKSVRVPARTIAFGDNDGTGWKRPHLNRDPDDTTEACKDPERFGNHGYTLDPTYIPERSLDAVNNDGQSEPYAWLNRRAYPSTRHGGGGNFCFVDGHVERMLPAQILQDNRYWNGLGAEDRRRDPHVWPNKHDPATEWRFEGTIPATGE